MFALPIVLSIQHYKYFDDGLHEAIPVTSPWSYPVPVTSHWPPPRAFTIRYLYLSFFDPNVLKFLIPCTTFQTLLQQISFHIWCCDIMILLKSSNPDQEECLDTELHLLAFFSRENILSVLTEDSILRTKYITMVSRTANGCLTQPGICKPLYNNYHDQSQYREALQTSMKIL